MAGWTGGKGWIDGEHAGGAWRCILPEAQLPDGNFYLIKAERFIPSRASSCWQDAIKAWCLTATACPPGMNRYHALQCVCVCACTTARALAHARCSPPWLESSALFRSPAERLRESLTRSHARPALSYHRVSLPLHNPRLLFISTRRKSMTAYTRGRLGCSSRRAIAAPTKAANTA